MNLTLRAYGLALFIVGLGILGQWVPEAVSPYWWKLFTALGLALLTIEYLHTRHYRLAIRLSTPALSYLGTSQPLQLQFNSHYPGPVKLAYHLPIIDGELREAAIYSLRLSPQGQAQRQLQFIPTRLQRLDWQHIQCSQLGLFGLAWWSYRSPLQASTRVVPDSLDSQTANRLGNRYAGLKHRRHIWSGMELHGIREYRNGDPMHAIDWKASARSRQLKTRIYEEEQHLELIIAIDAGRTSALAAGELTRLGHYCNIAARLAEKAMLHGDHIGLVVYAEDVLSAETGLRGHQGLLRLRQTLEQLRSSSQDANPINAVMKIRSLAQQRALVVFLSDVDDGYAARQLNSSLKLLRPKHFPVLAGITEQAILDIHEQVPRRWLDPFRLLSANELILNWRQLRLQLAQLGIPVVSQPAHRLSREILDTYEQLIQQRRV